MMSGFLKRWVLKTDSRQEAVWMQKAEARIQGPPASGGGGCLMKGFCEQLSKGMK